MHEPIKTSIRTEEAGDYEAVGEVVEKAFESAEHSDGTERELVAALRKSSAFIPELSLVAEVDGKIAGHILFTKITVGGAPALALAPLAVLPELQRRGIGSALIEEGHKRAAQLGFGWSIVLGSEKYYPKFGYKMAEEFSINVPEGFPSINFMAKKLSPDAAPVSGDVKYAPEFGL